MYQSAQGQGQEIQRSERKRGHGLICVSDYSHANHHDGSEHSNAQPLIHVRAGRRDSTQNIRPSRRHHMCQRSPKLTIRRRLTHRSQEFHFGSGLRTNITPLSPLSIFCVRSNANAPGVTCLTAAGSKNTRPCHFEAHSRTRLRQLPGRPRGRLVGVVTASWRKIAKSLTDNRKGATGTKSRLLGGYRRLSRFNPNPPRHSSTKKTGPLVCIVRFSDKCPRNLIRACPPSSE